MYEDLILLMMGVVVAALLLTVVIVQSRLSRSKPEVIEEPEEEKIFVELGFEPEEVLETEILEPANESTGEFEQDPIESAYEPFEELPSLEPEKVFIEASESVIIETPKMIVEDHEPEPEPEPEEEPIKPMFEARYEPSEPVVIESPEMVVIEEPETVEFDTDREGPLFDVSYEESKPVVIETDSMILKPEEVVESEPEVDMELAPVEDPEPKPDVTEETPEPEEEHVLEPVDEPEVVEEIPEPEIVEEPLEPEPLIEEIKEVSDEPEIFEVSQPRQLRSERKPIIDESDPDINMDIGIKSCPHCDSEVPDTIYCINCGKSLDPEES